MLVQRESGDNSEIVEGPVVEAAAGSTAEPAAAAAAVVATPAAAATGAAATADAAAIVATSKWLAGMGEGTAGDHEPIMQVLGRAGRADAVAAAPPPLASATVVPAPTAAPVAPPLPSPAVAAAAPAAAIVTPLLSHAVSVTAPAAAGRTPALPTPGAAVTPPLLSPAAIATTPPAALVNPLLSLYYGCNCTLRGVDATVPAPPAPAPPEPAPPPLTPPGPPVPPARTPPGSATTGRREERGGNSRTDGKSGGDAGRGRRVEGPAPSGVSQVDAVEPVEVAGDSGAGSGGAEPGGAGSGGAGSGGAEPRGAGSGGAEPGGAESGGAEPGGAEPGSAEPGGGEPGGARSTRVASRSASHAAGAGGTPGAAGTGGAAAAAGVGPAGGTAGAAGGTGAAGPAGVGAAGASGAPGAGAAEGVSVGGSPDAGSSAGAGVGAVGAGGAAGTSAADGGTGAVPSSSGDLARPRPYFVLLLELVLGLPPSSGPAPSLECPQPVQSQSLLQPVSPLPAPSPYTGPTGGLAERREPASRPASPVRAASTTGRAPRQRPPVVPRTHQMALRPSTASQRVPLPSPPASSLPVLADPESDSLCAARPTIAHLLSTVVTDPSFESAAASALVAELVDLAACCRLDYAAGLVAESASVCPPSVGGECALSTDVLEDRQEEFLCFAAALPHLVSPAASSPEFPSQSLLSSVFYALSSCPSFSYLYPTHLLFFFHSLFS
ncbi:unnamed protein product [Closterium sp. NIES-54]